MAIKIINEARENIEDYSIQEIIEMYYNGYFDLIPKNEGFPMPWDADLEYDSKTDTIILTGGAGPSGYGSCVTKFPAKDLFKIFDKG